MEVRDVELSDAELLFEWANDPDTRLDSFHTEIIAWDTHLSWLKNKLKETNRSFFLFFQDKESIGVARFETKGEIVIGITVAPHHRGKGLGSLMIQLACSRFHETNDADVLAYIKKSNIQSQKSFEKAGFDFLRYDTFNGEDCLILIAKKHVNE